MQFDKNINDPIRQKNARRCKDKGISIPTLSQLMHPDRLPPSILNQLPKVGLAEIHPLNLFRISWKNDLKTGLFGDVNCLEIPQSLTGVKARIVGLIGSHFPTGAHKVGAAFGCLVPPLVQGRFDPETEKAVWPSTGNYCRGGAFDCALLHCHSIAILPEGMSAERFEWLKKIGAEVIRTPGCESNVKEIYDKCHEIRRTRKDCVIFNQFEEFGNAAWHYHVTGNAVEEAFEKLRRHSHTGTLTPAHSGYADRLRLSGFVSATGSAGTIAAGDYLRRQFPHLRVAAAEALQCPTLLQNGFGDHRIEGIGDKHVPWIHNVRNTDAVIAIDDEATLRCLRLFNEAQGQKCLQKEKIDPATLSLLPWLGISGICNLLASIKLARYFEFTENDVVFTVFTDSATMYQSRLRELTEQHGPYSETQAKGDLETCLRGVKTDCMKELKIQDQKALHNLKYFTWVEQQGKSADELRALWEPSFWDARFAEAEAWDGLIAEFNELAHR